MGDREKGNDLFSGEERDAMIWSVITSLQKDGIHVDYEDACVWFDEVVEEETSMVSAG